MSMVQVASEGFVWVCGPAAAGACLWSLLLPETKWRPMTHAPTNCEEPEGYFYCYINDCRCTVEEDMDGCCNNP